MKKILLLSVSAGAGHVRAAEAIRAFAVEHPAGVEVVHLDVMDFVPAGFRSLYAGQYIKLVNDYPEFWSYLYRKTNEALPQAPGQKLRRAIERLNCRPLLAEVQQQDPDAIICTHFLPAELLSRQLRKGRAVPPVWVLVTDFDLHSLWLAPHMRGYFVASEEIAWRARQRGIAADAVMVSGIPIMPAFSARLERGECAGQFGLDPARPTFLLMAGGVGMNGLELLAARLLAMPGDFQLVALAGRNEAMLTALRQLAQQHPGRLFPQGFTHQIERLMACSDLAITKPGGLTTSECLAMGLPMIVHSPIPGQEERNADYLLEQGAALKAIDGDAIAYRVAALLAAPERLAALRQRSLALGRPQAGRVVLDRVLSATPG
jgi:processive 1,2-diacylglycerol beta-glucosyltransferase